MGKFKHSPAEYREMALRLLDVTVVAPTTAQSVCLLGKVQAMLRFAQAAEDALAANASDSKENGDG